MNRKRTKDEVRFLGTLKCGVQAENKEPAKRTPDVLQKKSATHFPRVSLSFPKVNFTVVMY